MLPHEKEGCGRWIEQNRKIKMWYNLTVWCHSEKKFYLPTTRGSEIDCRKIEKNVRGCGSSQLRGDTL